MRPHKTVYNGTVWIDQLNELELLPRGRQYEALRNLRAVAETADHEQWNTAFDSAGACQTRGHDYS